MDRKYKITETEETLFLDEPIPSEFSNIYVYIGKTDINNNFTVQPVKSLHTAYTSFEKEHILKLNTIDNKAKIKDNTNFKVKNKYSIVNSKLKDKI